MFFFCLELLLVHEDVSMQWWLRNRKLIPKPVRRGFDSLFFLIGRMLWKERNARTFNRIATPAPQLVQQIEVKLNDRCLAGYKHLVSLMSLL